MFHEDGRTDMTKLIVAFGSFANTPKISLDGSGYTQIFPNISEAYRVDVLPVNDACY